MRKIILIRHAESVANTGDLILHKNIIRLSKNGYRDSIEFSKNISRIDRIILSKYIRTIETAEPIYKKFPKSEVHLWYDLHEFDYVNPESLIYLSVEHRKLTEQNYWDRLDPFVRDSPERENFKEFVDRVIKIIEKLQKINEGVNYVFTHGMIIKLIMVLLSENIRSLSRNQNDDFYKKIMKKFVDFEMSTNINIKNLFEIEITEIL